MMTMKRFDCFLHGANANVNKPKLKRLIEKGLKTVYNDDLSSLFRKYFPSQVLTPLLTIHP